MSAAKSKFLSTLNTAELNPSVSTPPGAHRRITPAPTPIGSKIKSISASEDSETEEENFPDSQNDKNQDEDVLMNLDDEQIPVSPLKKKPKQKRSASIRVADDDDEDDHTAKRQKELGAALSAAAVLLQTVAVFLESEVHISENSTLHKEIDKKLVQLKTELTDDRIVLTTAEQFDKVTAPLKNYVVVDIREEMNENRGKLSSYYHHMSIPVPFEPASSKKTAISVAAIWNALKVFEKEGGDFWVLSKEVQQRKATEKRGKFLGWAQSLPENKEDKLYSLVEARLKLQYPAYVKQLQKFCKDEFNALQEYLNKGKKLVIVDHNAVNDIDHAAEGQKLSSSWILKAELLKHLTPSNTNSASASTGKKKAKKDEEKEESDEDSGTQDVDATQFYS